MLQLQGKIVHYIAIEKVQKLKPKHVMTIYGEKNALSNAICVNGSPHQTRLLSVMQITCSLHRELFWENIPSYRSCDHKEPSADSQKPPDILNSKDERSPLPGSKSICKLQKHTINWTESFAQMTVYICLRSQPQV